jgi:hypothetical protein
MEMKTNAMNRRCFKKKISYYFLLFAVGFVAYKLVYYVFEYLPFFLRKVSMLF